ncbi:MAG: hemerythrin domain-containing protein [Deltaproteobacteria bacterium]|nr:hemerythrin domain-containing protein [Deltaproteobacteria bacterium]
MSSPSTDHQSLSDAILAAEAGQPQSVALAGPARPVLRELVIGGALRRAWLMLENERPITRVAVRPRDAAQVPSVFGILEDDHRRLDAMAAEMIVKGAEDPAVALTLGHDFVYGLRRHIRIEEELLFPIFDARSGMQGQGPTQVMRAEHRMIERELDRIVKGVEAHARGDAGAWRDVVEAVGEMEGVLGPHNMKEERILYPMIDRFVAGPEQAEVLARLVLWE